MTETADVVIIGGAVMGSAIAYFLAVDPAFDGRLVVIERDPSYADCATTRSWGGIRQQFSTPENINMGLFAAEFVKTAKECLAVDGEVPDFFFRENGYLFLASQAGQAVLQGKVRLQQELGARIETLDAEALSARFAWLNTEDLAAGSFGSENEGWIAPDALLHAFRRKAASLGVDYIQGAATKISSQSGGTNLISLDDGRTIAGERVVIAAGPNSGAVAEMAGASLPVSPRKRMTYVFDCREAPGAIPLTIDTSGVAFRPEGQHYLAIISPPQDADPDCFDLDEDYSLFEEIIWPALAHRVPAFEAIKLVRAWAGHYDYNSFDQNALIGAHPEIPNLYVCTGFSGHGIQQAPAAGRAMAELILHGRYLTLDLSAFGLERLVENRPIKEVAVV